MPRRAPLARAFLFACLALAPLLTVPTKVAAAEVGGVRGRVTDPSGQALAGVTVTLSRQSTGTQHGGAVTDARGVFQIAGVPSGSAYRLQCALPGYGTVVLSDVEVQPGIATTLTVTLSPEKALRESVQVKAAPPVVALSETTTQSRFSSEFIDSLPILGRNYQDVLTLAPGVSDVDGDGNPNIHGARDTDVVTLVDGVSTTDPYTGKVGAQLNIESIQEIEVKTSGANAEYGRAQGGMVNIVTKSGGNQFEGAFKFYWRGSALDGDGAGIDDPSLHGGIGESGLRDLEFNDFLPFVSLGGPIVKDRAWFFATLEYIQREDPVNAVNTAFVSGVKEYRAFGKATWQATGNTRLALSINYDPQEYLNQGLNSLTREETGFSLKAGGTNVTLRSTSVLSPSVVLEGTLGFLDTHPALIPNIGYDTNGNGLLFTDRNGDGFTQANERDGGTDFDNDGVWDVWEDTHIRNGRLDIWEAPSSPTADDLILWTEDQDGDGRLTPRGGCEGATREDIDCDGRLDVKDEDLNLNGRLDGTEDLDGDRHLDRGDEDRNGDGILNDRPFPGDLYPYGTLAPTPPDRDYFINEETGITEGPYFEELEDTRQRSSVRADLSVFVPDFKGNHDFRFGGLYEREAFDRTTERHDLTALQPAVDPICDEETGECGGGRPEALVIVLPTQRTVEGAASGATGAIYAQDTWRPIPNLSIGLGVRYEHETARAPGFTDFDPRQQRDVFDALVTLSGGEVGKDDVRTGNRDGVANLGISGDPLLFGGEGGGSGFANDLINAMRLQAIRHLTRHRSNLEFSLDSLAGLYGDLGSGGTIDPVALSQLGVTVQQPEAIGITNDNLSPRLAVSWDPTGDSRTKLFGTWGRYYDKLFLSTLVGEQGPDTVYRYYAADPDGIDVVGGGVNGSLPRTITNHGVGRLFTKSAPSIRQVDRNLATPYCDEWTLGFEREIAPEVALAVRYIHRDFRDQLQDSDINHEVVTNPFTGEPYDLFGIQYIVQGRFGDMRIQQPDGRPDLYIQNPFFNQVLRVENSNTAAYGAFELELRRRMSRRWEMQGSYVYSRAQGNAEDFQSKVGNDPSVTESEYGYLSFDQRHVVKVNASIFLPRDFQLGIVTSWSSGLPYSVISRFFASDNTGYSQFRTLFGFTELNPSGTGLEFHSLPRNSERNGAVLDINTSIRKSFVLGRTTGAVSFEVMNLLNSDDLRVLTYEPVTGSGFDVGGDGALTPLQLDATRRFGRRFQIGFQFSF